MSSTVNAQLTLLLNQIMSQDQQGDMSEALATFQRSLSMDENNFESLLGLGILTGQTGRFDEAVSLLKRAASLQDHHYAVYYYLGKALHGLKRYDEALASYDAALRINPGYAETYNQRGIILKDLGRYEDAISSCDRAIALKPNFADAYYNRGNALGSLGRLNDALASYDQALSLEPDYAEAYYKRGLALQYMNNIEGALASYDRAIALKSDYPDAFYKRGIILNYLSRHEEALVSLERTIIFMPDYAEAYLDRGIILQILNRYADALASYDRAIALKPDLAGAYINRGVVLQEMNRYEEALSNYDQAITLNPALAEAYINRGIILHKLNRHADALACFDQAITLKPDSADAYYNRGITLQCLIRYPDALASYDRAIALQADHMGAYNNRGVVLQNMKRQEDALASYDRAIAINPDYADAFYNRGIAFYFIKRFEDALDDFSKVISLDPHHRYVHGYRLAAQMHIGLWEDFDHRVKELIELIDQGILATVPFTLLAIPVSSKILLKYASNYVAGNYLPAPPAVWQGERYGHERIRLGYFSADFRDHSTAYLIAELIEKHDRTRFEIFAFSFGIDQYDTLRARLVKAFDHFIDVSNHSDLDIAELARKHEIDIAIDLMGFTGNARTGIFALRPAPIQVNYHTYASTMGAPFIDYLIADPVVIPKVDFDNYSEKVVQLPHCYVVSDSKRPIADSTPTRPSLGLPETGFVFCTFNNHYKFTPDVFTIWMRLLANIDGSVLWLKGYEDNVTLKMNLQREAQKRNVDPERLIFSPRLDTAEHLARHRLADLYLDTFYHGAGTTASDALWAGLPVLTCMGETLAGRVAASLLHAIGLPELVAHSHEEYESLALYYATHPEALAAIRLKLGHNRSTYPIFNTDLFAQHIESAFDTMWRRVQNNQAPDHIFIAP